MSGQAECNLTQRRARIQISDKSDLLFIANVYIGEEENMSADPEAYAEYYSFYLKYYTQKYSRHTCQLNENRFL